MSWKNSEEYAKDDDEIDYMSDEFLLHCTKVDDVRPGLIHNHATKRKYEQEKKKKLKDNSHRKHQPSFKTAQEESLKEGLNTAISSSNKGFAMLQKMGYTPGSSLGKSGSGRLEPVNVDLKTDRGGLGWQQVMQEKKKKKVQQMLKRLEDKKHFDAEDYRNRKRQELLEKRLFSDLRKCQRECFNLDSSKDIKEPAEYWFWPPEQQPSVEEEESLSDDEPSTKKTKECLDHLNEDEEILHGSDEINDDIYEPEDQIEIITGYLRETHNYCIWCGIIYNDESDMLKNCPGINKDDHDD